MTNKTNTAIAKIRAKLGLKRLAPSRLYLVDDGAYHWIGDRGDLTAADARALSAINSVGSNPASATREDREAYEAADYDVICSRCPCLAASHGASGIVSMDDLPQDWRDGYALGPISPL